MAKVHIYCGDGKGKTTAAFGLALRAQGAGYTVVVAQFLKTTPSCEVTALASLPRVTVLRVDGDYGFTWTLTDTERAELRAAHDDLLRRAIGACPASGQTLLVLDEAIGADAHGYLDGKPLRDFLAALPAHIEVVLTGRDPAEDLLACADYVTRMKCVRHPYERGQDAREGIEY